MVIIYNHIVYGTQITIVMRVNLNQQTSLGGPKWDFQGPKMEVPHIYIYIHIMEVPYIFRILKFPLIKYYNIIPCMYTHQIVTVYLYKRKSINVICRMIMITI